MTSYIYNMVDTWNNGATTFTSIKMDVTDTASNAASLLMDLQVGSVSAFNVSKGGSLKLGLNTSGTNVAASNVTISGAQGTGSGAGGSIVFQVAPAGSTGATQNALATAFQVNGSGGITGQDGATANTLALRNSTAAQRFNVYNTYTTSTNYEAFKIDWITTANTVLVGTEKGSVGGTARDLEFQRDGTTQIVLANSETRIGPGASPLITFGQSSASTSARFGFYGGAQLVNSLVSGAVSLRLTNGALSDFGLLQFGGSTSSFPALKRSTTVLQARLADDSAFAPVQGKLTTDTAYTAGAIVATGYLTLYDSTGTAYRVPCVV